MNLYGNENVMVVFVNSGKVTCVIFNTQIENCRKIHGDLPVDRIHWDKQITLCWYLFFKLFKKISYVNPKFIELYRNILYLWKNLPRLVVYNYCMLLYLLIAAKKLV